MKNQHIEKSIFCDVIVPASIKEVWKAWTTNEGVKSFFAPDCNVELKVMGPYEILFDLNAKPGSQGGEGLFILAFEEYKMLSFVWNAPPEYPNIRGQFTHVIIRLEEISGNETHVTLYHDGWGEGDEWQKVYDYFVKAWDRVIMPRLKYRFENGPVDWNNPPRFDI